MASQSYLLLRKEQLQEAASDGVLFPASEISIAHLRQSVGFNRVGQSVTGRD